MNRKKIRTVILLVIGILILVASVTWVDGERVRSMKEPLFAGWNTHVQTDGSVRYSGIGYTIVRYEKEEAFESKTGEDQHNRSTRYTFDHLILPISLRVTERSRVAN